MVNKSKRLYQELAQHLKADLTSEKLAKPGEKLPAERELSEMYSVSRTTVREALIMLELNGVVDVRKGAGIFYLDHPEKDALFHSAAIGPFELLQARQWFESSIAELAAKNISNSQLKELKDLILPGPCDDDGDRRIHFLIAEGTHNNMMIKTAYELWEARQTDMWGRMIGRVTDLDAVRQTWHEDHQHIMHALMRRDSKSARRSMWQHLENVKNVLFEASDIDDPEFDGYLFVE